MYKPGNTWQYMVIHGDTWQYMLRKHGNTWQNMGSRGTIIMGIYSDYTKVKEMYDISKIQLLVYYQCCILIG